MGGVIAAIFAVAKAVPIVDSWLQQLTAAYVAYKIDSMKKEDIDAIRAAVQLHDQRQIEAALGNPNPGEASGQAGAVIIGTTPPGVPK